jgi:hypothetical protein
LKRVIFGAWPIVLLGNPVKVASFFASIAEETGLFPAVEVKWLVAVEQLINFVNALILEGFFND